MVADTVSSAKLFLLGGTTWAGVTGIEENAAGATSDAPLAVSVDATSTWVVTADSEVSELNVADGGVVVDETGAAVNVVAVGQTVVAGASALTVTVDGAYGLQFAMTQANELSSDVIDRAVFDERFGTATSWTMTG